MKLYGLLLKLYPARFREEYQTLMERQFQDDYRETGNRVERAALWLHAIRDVFTTAPVELVRELTRDVKHGIRVYRRRALSTALAVVALGLAIGASTGVFSVLNALLLRGLPFSSPSQLVELWIPAVSAINGRAAFTDWSRHNAYLQDAAAFSSSDMNLTGGRDALRIRVAETSANFFRLLGTQAAAGRTFVPDDGAVAVISYGLWQQRFGGDPSVAGQTVHVNGIPLTVIGVAPAGFDYPDQSAVWTPSVFDFEKVPKRGAFLFETIGRLKPAVTFKQAQLIFDAEARHAHPERFRDMTSDEQTRPHLISLQDQLAGPVRSASWVLAGMTVLVLLTACANVAQLLLSRTTERRQELEVRASLGASRARLLQQLVTEATLLTLTAAALGLVIAYWTTRIATSVVPAQLATQAYTLLDWRVLGFASALALAMGFVFGVIPAWLVGRLQPSGQVVRSAAGAPDVRTKRVRTGLVALQAALTLCLVTGSIALGGTFLRLLHTDLGFRPANVVTLNVSLQGTRHKGPGEWRYYSDALQRLRALPGVDAGGAVSYLPLAANLYMAGAFKLDSGQTVSTVVTNAVMPGYFAAMGIRFLAGSDFSPVEGRISTRPVIVNEAFARSAGLGTSIVGRYLTASWANQPYRIAGVVHTSSFNGPSYPGGPQVFWPIEEEPPPTLTFVAHVHGDPENYLARSRDAIRAVDPQVPVYEVKALDQRLADNLARPRFYTTATLFLALLAVLLAAVGIYGTASYSIAQRKQEMGVRMAVGASYPRIRAMLLRESAAPILWGAAAGIYVSLVSGRYLARLIVNAAEPGVSTCAAAAAFLLIIGALAAWLATARVLSIDPADAIRAE